MEKNLDLLLINPGSRRQVYQSLGDTLTAIEPPVWAGMMATFVRREGFSVQVLDAEAEDITPEETADQATKRNPMLTAVVVFGHQPSASTQEMTAAGAICTAIKERDPKARVLLVGGHVAALPERTLQEEDVDFVAGGEGPYTIVDLLKALNGGRGEDIKKVRGLWYWEDKQVQSNPPAPLLNNLDQLIPELAWDLLPMDKYRAHNWHCFGGLERAPYGSIYTTLGCPFHCSFCCIQAPFKSGEKVLGFKEAVNTYRFWSPEAVVAQIDTLVNDYGVRNIKIADEMFVLNRRHIDGICDLIIERGYDLNIWAYARVDTVKEGMADKLKAAGFNWLAFGVEAASEKVRAYAQKGFHQDLVYKTIESVREAGIYVAANFIFGLPEDDQESMQATLDMALELNCEVVNFYATMAYPGSELYDLAIREGWPLPEKWSGYSQHSVDSLPLPTRQLSGPSVLAFRDHAFQVYFNNPRYLEMIARRFGAGTVDDIRQMAAHTLARQHPSPSPAHQTS
jgi:radical SAM superfamily enzyme YgiQ (UPF0313 family)